MRTSGQRDPASARRAERLWILGILAAILVITSFWFLIEKAQTYSDLPFPSIWGTGFFLFLWVANWLLILVLVVLILRNLTKLFLERRAGVLGSRFKTKLVLAFTALCLLPSVLLMSAAVKVIEWSVDRWFSLDADLMIEQAQGTWEELRELQEERVAIFAGDVARGLDAPALARRDRLQAAIEQELHARHLDRLAVHFPDGSVPAQAQGPQASLQAEGPGEEFLEQVLAGRPQRRFEEHRDGFVVWAGAPVTPEGDERVRAAVLAGQFLPRGVLDRAESLARTAIEYRQAKVRKPEIKTIFVLLFVLLTLLTVFAAVWIGLTVSRTITDPVEALTAGTRRVQSGDLDVRVETTARDELGVLVDSFNEMVHQLEEHKAGLEQASEEAERRSRYIETLLQNLTTGVLSLDRSGRVTLANRAFFRTLRLPAGADATGLTYEELLSLPGHQPLREAIAKLLGVEQVELTREITLDLGPQTVHLAASFAALRDRQDRPIGLLVVLDDLTDLVRAQRVAAWREVARRMAHEIKNPLTPIQLAVQRMLKAHRSGSSELPRILEDGAETVIQEVDALRRFVDEFSRFARLPASNPVPTDLREVVESSVKLYEANEKARIETELDEVPEIALDPEQMRRVLGNLIDNALEVQNGGGKITVRTCYVPDRQSVSLEVADEGPGIPPEMRDRLFVPYFSTKDDGSGLGLAIVNRIVLDHNGRIRVEANQPRGSRFIVEIPA